MFALVPTAWSQQQPVPRSSAPREVKKIAAVCTVYTPGSHADAIITKFLAGFPTDEGLIPPSVKIAALYIDQGRADDLGHKLAGHYGVPIYPTIPKALTLDGPALAVDGVLLVAEHGDYPKNRFGETLYPRARFAEETFRVFEAAKRTVPVFLDKHLAYNWLDAKWIYDRARELDVPMMAGSSVPLAWREPPLDHPPGSRITEVVELTYAFPDSYGIHGMEVIQCMIEARKGGETGIASVECVRGKAVYQAADEGRFSMDLVEAAAATIAEKKAGKMKDHARDPTAMIVNYQDGTRATVIFTHEYYGMWWAYAARVNGKIEATQFIFPRQSTMPTFSYLDLNIQDLFLTGRPRYPLERTLLCSGIVDAACRSLTAGGKLISTPYLNIHYQPYDLKPIRPTASQPRGATLDPWPPEAIRPLWP